MNLLAKVENVFEISNRGTVVVPVWVTDLKVRVGDRIQLRALDGRVRDTHIAGVEFLKPQTGNCRAAFILARDVAKDEITEGMEIWLSDATE